MTIVTPSPDAPLHDASPLKPKRSVARAEAVRNALRYSLYAALVVIILTLTGIFGEFASRQIIRDLLSLDTLTLVLMLFASGYLVASVNRSFGVAVSIASGVAGGCIVAMALFLILQLELLVPFSDLKFIFANYQSLSGSAVVFGQNSDTLTQGVLSLFAFAAATGLAAGIVANLAQRWRNILFVSALMTIVIALLQDQINKAFSLPDALAIGAAFLLGYGIALLAGLRRTTTAPLRIIAGAVMGLVVGGAVYTLATNDAGALIPLARSVDTSPLLQFVANPVMIAVYVVAGAFGALMTVASRAVHNGSFYFITTLLILGLINDQPFLTLPVLLFIFLLLCFEQTLLLSLATRAQQAYSQFEIPGQNHVKRTAGIVGLFVIFIAPLFLSAYVTNVLDLVMLYIVMGIGLNVMVGFAGLLDLGYVASFAIGAYTAALLMTPSIITTGCGAEFAGERYFEMCVGAVAQWQGIGVLSFWGAWPIAIVVSALTGMALGVPVLRLRGDYLAIVTLGFGEITRVLSRANVTKPLLGSAQGISPVPFPVLDLSALNPAWVFEFNNAQSVYYLYVISVLIAAFVVLRVAGSRIGRAWRAIKADEDVAQAMGIRLVRTKLLAFGLSSAFAGMGGALFAAQLRGIFPDSFTLFVSINVLSLIIIGGLGSIPGVVVGSFVLVGLPEALRELQDYRLLAFGVLLVVAMLLKPEGLLPPVPARLSEAFAWQKRRIDRETS